MKSTKEILSELGFKKDSAESTQKAFIKYLIRVGLKTEIQDNVSKVSINKEEIENIRQQDAPVQLSFEFYKKNG